uniref:laminin subunit alpha-2-like n=1 Tax=Myxine glutinosa TaxID=7769 RepID=UPI0035901A93
MAMATGNLSILLVLLFLSISEGHFSLLHNLNSMVKIETNATCGELEVERYCKLVAHVSRSLTRDSQCSFCNMNSLYPTERHPITNAIDGTNSWWQSPSIQNGLQYHYVTITLDLQQSYTMAEEMDFEVKEFVEKMGLSAQDVELLRKCNYQVNCSSDNRSENDPALFRSQYSGSTGGGCLLDEDSIAFRPRSECSSRQQAESAMASQ